ncbi:MAG: DUF6435 family protein [Myxococcota bacterium]
MFGWFRSDPATKLEKRWRALLKEAMELQRAGKIPEFARKTAEAERVRLELDALRGDNNDKS